MHDFDVGIIDCPHLDQDVIPLTTSGVVMYVVPRCLQCGQIKSEQGKWQPLALFVLAFLFDGEDESAIKTIELMQKGIEKGIPYPEHTEDDYRKELERIRPELEARQKRRIN